MRRGRASSSERKEAAQVTDRRNWRRCNPARNSSEWMKSVGVDPGTGMGEVGVGWGRMAILHRAAVGLAGWWETGLVRRLTNGLSDLAPLSPGPVRSRFKAA